MSGFCDQTVECLPASAGLLHGVVVCMALYMSALALDQRNAEAVLSRPLHSTYAVQAKEED